MGAFQPTKNELIEGMEQDEYRGSHAVSSSTLKDFDRSAAYAKKRIDNPEPPTKAMEFGTALHVAVLEPDEMDKRYAEDPQSPKGGYPKGWRNTTAYGEAKAVATAGGQLLLSADDRVQIEAMRNNIAEHEAGRMMLDAWEATEVSGFAWDEEFQLWRKIRPDITIPEARMIVDLKKTAMTTRNGFERQCASLGYHESAAYYLDTLEMIEPRAYETYTFLPVVESPPHEVAAYMLDFDSLSQGRANYRRHLAQYAECMARDEWPGPNTKIEEIRLPSYALNMEDLY